MCIINGRRLHLYLLHYNLYSTSRTQHITKLWEIWMAWTAPLGSDIITLGGWGCVGVLDSGTPLMSFFQYVL